MNLFLMLSYLQYFPSSKSFEQNCFVVRGQFGALSQANKDHMVWDSNGKSLIVEERILRFVFVPSIDGEQILHFVFVPSIVEEQILRLVFVPSNTLVCLHSFDSLGTNKFVILRPYDS